MTKGKSRPRDAGESGHSPSGTGAGVSSAPPESQAPEPATIERQMSPLRRGFRRRAALHRPGGACRVEEARRAADPAGGSVGASDIRFAGLGADEPAPVEMRHPEAARAVMEVVIGFDDRLQVTPTLDYPWRCVCMLRATAADGSLWFGSGWLAGPRLVVTAGHVVHIAARGGWVREIEVIPGADGAGRPFGSAISRRFRSVSGWVRDQDPGLDYGAILLPPDAAFGAHLGYFGIASLDDGDLAGNTVQLSGYPADKPTGTNWHHAREIQRVEPKILYYDIDTAGGQSGAPVWTELGGNRYVVGIHSGGHVTGNSAVRLTDTVYDNIIAWNGET